MPGDDAFTADLNEEQPWLKDLHGKSVTELEILHGVLNNPETAPRAFFYVRAPAYAEARGADFLSEGQASADRIMIDRRGASFACRAEEPRRDSERNESIRLA